MTVGPMINPDGFIYLLALPDIYDFISIAVQKLQTMLLAHEAYCLDLILRIQIAGKMLSFLGPWQGIRGHSLISISGIHSPWTYVHLTVEQCHNYEQSLCGISRSEDDLERKKAGITGAFKDLSCPCTVRFPNKLLKSVLVRKSLRAHSHRAVRRRH